MIYLDFFVLIRVKKDTEFQHFTTLDAQRELFSSLF